MLGYRQEILLKDIIYMEADEGMGREHFNVSPKEQVAKL